MTRQGALMSAKAGEPVVISDLLSAANTYLTTDSRSGWGCPDF